VGQKSEALLRLFEAFSKKPNQAKLYYYEKWASGLPIDEVTSIIDAVVMDESFLPTPNKLYTLTRKRSVFAEDAPEEECWFCDKTGMIPGIWKDKQNLWTDGVISACKCSKGSRVSSKEIPQRIFEHDIRYIDLLKYSKEVEGEMVSPWGCLLYYEEDLRAKRRQDK